MHDQHFTSVERFGRAWRSERGAALVEFALAVPLLCLVLFATIDFARVFYMASALTNAARAGAQYGSQSLAKTTDATGMWNAAWASGSVDIPTGFVIWSTNARTCECSGVAQGCPPTTPCNPPSVTRIYVTVTTTKIFTTILSWPGYPHTISLVRSATLRAQ